jgi:hypothetical protein
MWKDNTAKKIEVPKKDHTLTKDDFIEGEDSIYQPIDGKACIREYLRTPSVPLRAKIHQWFLIQGIDESEDVTLDMPEIHFLAKLLEFEGPISYRRGIRGYIINYGVNEVEFSLRMKDYGVFFRHYGEDPNAVGPKAYIVNVYLSDEAKAHMEAKLSSC